MKYKHNKFRLIFLKCIVFLIVFLITAFLFFSFGSHFGFDIVIKFFAFFGFFVPVLFVNSWMNRLIVCMKTLKYRDLLNQEEDT